MIAADAYSKKKVKSMKQCVDEKDFPAVKYMKSGKWGNTDVLVYASGRHQSEKEHPVVYLTAFDTVDETNNSKKRKQSNDSCQGDADVCELDEPIDGSSDTVKCLKSGKWEGKIQLPISKVWVLVGIYTSPEEAADACAKKKLEYESLTVEETDTKVIDSAKEAAHPDNMSKLDCKQKSRTRRANGSGGVYKTKSGKWRAEIGIRKARHHVGTYATREDAEAAINLKKRDLVLKAEKAKEDYRNKKQKQGNHSCQEYAVMDATSGSVFNADGEEGSMPNVNDESIGEFDVVNCYGQLVGEYSRMDDDLWLC